MKPPRVPERTTPGFAFSIVDRSLADCFADRRFGAAETEEVLGFFEKDPAECVFCGSVEVRRWDHLLPVTRGGDTVLGNMVPACSSCDDSKRDLDFADWMASQAPGSPLTRGVRDLGRRMERIRAYVAHYKYAAKSREERLAPDEAARHAEIRRKLGEVRQEIEDLIGDFRRRTGLK